MTMFMGMAGCVGAAGAAGLLGGLARGVGKDAQGAEGGVDGLGDLHLFFLVGFGEGVEDDEEGEEQGDEVGIGDQPAVVADVAFAPLAASCGALLLFRGWRRRGSRPA